MEKILIEIYDCYGNSAEVTKKATSFVIESMDELGEALEDENYEWLAEIGDPVAYKLVRYSYDEKMKELERVFQLGKEKLNKLFGK